MGQATTAEEAASEVFYVASEGDQFVNGADLVVDGDDLHDMWLHCLLDAAYSSFSSS